MSQCRTLAVIGGGFLDSNTPCPGYGLAILRAFTAAERAALDRQMLEARPKFATEGAAHRADLRLPREEAARGAPPTAPSPS